MQPVSYTGNAVMLLIDATPLASPSIMYRHGRLAVYKCRLSVLASINSIIRIEGAKQFPITPFGITTVQSEEVWCIASWGLDWYGDCIILPVSV